MAGNQGFTVDLAEFRKLVASLSGEELGKGLRGGVGRAMTVVTKAVRREARARININRAGHVERSRVTGLLVRRVRLDRDVSQFTWKKALGATAGLFPLRRSKRYSRSHVLRFLDQGTKDRYTWRGKKYRGRIEAGKYSFFERGVAASIGRARSAVAAYTLAGLRRMAARH